MRRFPSAGALSGVAGHDDRSVGGHGEERGGRPELFGVVVLGCHRHQDAAACHLGLDGRLGAVATEGAPGDHRRAGRLRGLVVSVESRQEVHVGPAEGLGGPIDAQGVQLLEARHGDDHGDPHAVEREHEVLGVEACRCR